MHDLYELKDKLMKELSEYSGNSKFSKDDVEAIKYITSAIDHICNIVEDEDVGYSMRGGSYEGGGMSGNMGGSYRSGGSYARGGRGRGRGGRRGANQYGSYGSYAGGSYGYSRADSMIDKLNEIMEDAPETMKSDVQRLITKAEQM